MTPRPVGSPDAVRSPDVAPDARPIPPAEPVQRWRLVLRRAAVAAGADQRQWQTAFADALLRSGLSLAGADAAPPRPRLVLAAPLPAGIPGERELADLYLTERVPGWRVREVVVAALPEGDTLVEAFDVWLGEAPLPGRVTASVYRTTVPGSADRDALATGLTGAAAAMLAATTLPRVRRKGDALVPYELRPFLAGLTISTGPGGSIEIRSVLRHDPEKGIGRHEEVVAELGERVGLGLEPIGIVRERILLADELPPARPPAPVPAPRARSRPTR